MAVEFRCEFPGCTVVKSADSEQTALGLLQLHQTNVHNNATQKQRPPKVDRPRIAGGATAEEWATFNRRWETFKSATDMSQAETKCQLLACCEQELEANLFKDDPKLRDKTEGDILASMKSLAVIDVAATVRVTELLAMKQDHGEGIRSFVARVRDAANICALEKACTCGLNVNYTDEVVRWVVLAGLSSPEIAREVLGTMDIDRKSLSDTVSIVESKERAARACMGESAVSAASTYKKEKKAVTINCKDCGKTTPKFGRNRRRKIVEYKLCTECFRAKQSGQAESKDQKELSDSKTAAVSQSGTFEVLGAMHNGASKKPTVQGTVDNLVFDAHSGWQTKNSKEQPMVTLEAQVDCNAYTQIGYKCPVAKKTVVRCISDTGAQSCLMGQNTTRQLGLKERDLVPVSRKMRAVNNEEITLSGVTFLTLSGRDKEGALHEAPVMVYVSPAVDTLYLSRAAMEQLKIISDSFPEVGSAAALKDIGHQLAACGCPRRSPPPDMPQELPFKATSENTEKMRQWILSRYAASTFNTCPHQPLPAMTGPPMSIRVKPDAEPVATSRPVRVPAHWREQVAEQLERDVALGVIERVPPGTPVTWLHNMVVTAKADGTPRRTVDLQALNKVSVRETHHTVPPAKQARSIPRNQIKTVTDAWNGYHSIPINAEDRDKLTFITEDGRYRYCRAPMGFLSSGDAYTHRYDLIIADVPRVTKCVDDVMLYDDIADLEGHWKRVMEYIGKVGHSGVVLNPDKFQFAVEEVDFTAFRITKTDVKPLPKYIKAIEDFPRPRNISDVRSWFGLVNQVAHYGQLVGAMAPFKSLLSPKTPFQWSDQLEESFVNSKKAIILAIQDGVEIFDPARKTCLQTDFSKQGLGYWLKQKHCDCRVDKLECCDNGWRVTLAGSRFLRDAESRYAPIEGECLGVAWALEDTRWFTLGCDDLLIATDHKPLLKILGDKCLDDITNPRLFRLKLQTMRWRFNIVHIAGKSNSAADATSRNPATESNSGEARRRDLCLESVNSSMESEVIADIRREARHHGVITWAELQKATSSDEELQELAKWVMNGFPDEKQPLSKNCQDYWQYREKLCVVDGVILLDQRMIIPKGLRLSVLQALHSAHQGTSGMTSRAQGCVFWPGISDDISKTHNQCGICNRIAPSQAHMPPIESNPPLYPFQAIAADYFSLRGVKFLVVVDRFSGWPHLMRATGSDEALGANGLIRCLKFIFATFGIPEEVSSDGGPEFVAAETQAFLGKWGVRHRLASAYNPRSNGRAEVAVKSMKRFLHGATTAEGALNEDAVIFGLLQYRNTPQAYSGTSPAQILFGRTLKDRIPIPPGTTIFEHGHTAPIWQETWKAREEALRVRFGKQLELLRRNTRDLPGLNAGDRCQIQNQHGTHANKWDRTGRVVEALPYNQYLVRVDGSGRITRRNRKALRKILAFEPEGMTVPPDWAQYVPALPEVQMPKRPERQDKPASGKGTSMDLQPHEGVPAESEVQPSEVAPDGAATSGESDSPPGGPEAEPRKPTNLTPAPVATTPLENPSLGQATDSEPTAVVPRRSTRLRRKPAYLLKDYEC